MGFMSMFLYVALPLSKVKLTSSKKIFLNSENIEIESSEGFTYSLELLVKCNRLKLKIFEIPAQWEERSEGESRFMIFKWLPAYLRWYFYGLSTTWLKKSAYAVKKKI